MSNVSTISRINKLKNKPSFSAVDKFNRCQRLWFINYIEGRYEPTPDVFTFGRKFHSYIAKLCKKSGYSDNEANRNLEEKLAIKAFNFTKEELELNFNSDILTVESKAFVNGTVAILDLVIQDNEGNIYIIDWKTVSGDYSDHQIRTSEQLDLYAAVYRYNSGEFPDYVCFVTANKKNGEVTIYRRKVDPSQVNQVLAKVNAYKNTIGVYGEVKDRYSCNPNSCEMYGRKCHFYDECWTDEEVEVITPKIMIFGKS